MRFGAIAQQYMVHPSAWWLSSLKWCQVSNIFNDRHPKLGGDCLVVRQPYACMELSWEFFILIYYVSIFRWERNSECQYSISEGFSHTVKSTYMAVVSKKITIGIPLGACGFGIWSSLVSLILQQLGHFYPSLVLALSYCYCLHLSVCLSVNPCVCINLRLFCAITHHLFKLGSPNLDQSCKTTWLRSLLFLGDWPWPWRSYLSYKSTFHYASFYTIVNAQTPQ